MLDVRNIEAEAVRKFYEQARSKGLHTAFVDYFEGFNAVRNQRHVATNPATPVKRNINEVYRLGRQEAGRV